MWTEPSYDRVEKELVIDGPLSLMIDFDDVNHDLVEFQIKLLIEILNEHSEHFDFETGEFETQQQKKWREEDE